GVPVCTRYWPRWTTPAGVRRSAWTSWSRTAANECSHRSAESAAWSAPNTSTPGPAPGAGRRGTPPDGSSPTGSRLAEQTDHAADDADQADVAGDDRLVGRVLGDQLHVAVAALKSLDRGV